MSHIVAQTLFTAVRYPRQALHSIFRGAVALVILLGGMTGQTIQALCDIQHPYSTIIGACLTFWCGPVIAMLGALGLPHTWYNVLVNNTASCIQHYGLFEGILRLAATGWQLLVHLPLGDMKINEKGSLSTLQLFFFREPDAFYDAPEYQVQNAVVKDEYWIYINGISTTKDIAEYNRHALYETVGRPIHLLHNPTDGVFVDLVECLVDKLGIGGFQTAPRKILFEQVRKRVTEAAAGKYKRVVLVAHSQGTIITSRAIRDLAKVDEHFNNLTKKYLEVFLFANASHYTPGENLAYLENLSNGRDTVSWLGAQFPVPDWWRDIGDHPITIDGVHVVEPDRFGHMWQAHYLDPLRYENCFRQSRMHQYKLGKTPSAMATLTDGNIYKPDGTITTRSQLAKK